MKYLTQFLRIAAITLVGELLQRLIPLPVPASVYGLILLFIALCTGVIKLEQVKDAAGFLISILPILFVPTAVGILGNWPVIKNDVIAIFLLALLSTCANWRVSSNAETGQGRSDIIVERKDRKIGFVVEVKDEKKLDAACEAAMIQIEERDYTAVLRRYRVKEIWTYGIAFWEKERRVVARKVGK